MVEMIANTIVEKMEEEKFLGQEMKDHYVYALVTMIERGITVLSVFCLSIVFKQIVTMLLFLTFFLALRKRTGGFHASSFLKCYLSTLIICSAIIVICPILESNINIMYALLFCSAIIIGLVGTVNHPNLMLDSFELKESKMAARYLLGLECMIIFSVIVLGVYKIYICYMAMAIILCAILLCIAKIFRQEVKP